jgi:threonine aldolase
MKIYDLRSDTVTKPGAGMRKAMAEAEVGDDVYGEDPTVNALQDLAAQMMGKEAALFVTTGSMGNLIPIYLNCGKGSEFLIEARGHSVQNELAGVSALAGSLPIMVSAPDGFLTPALLEPWIQPDIYYCARTRMIVLENTHNSAGGTVYPLPTLKDLGAFARGRGLSLHVDGARIFNAAAACGRPARELCADADTVTFCLSKGLGAPVGSVICGPRAFIAEARRVRKMLGGGMRQAGVIAAAGIYALKNNVERIGEDHENARLIAQALAQVGWAEVSPDTVASNMVYFRTPGREAAPVVQALETHGIRSGATGPDQIRLVTHLDVSREDTKEIVRIIGSMKL